MEKEFKIIQQLTPDQRREFDQDVQQIYLECHKALKGKVHRLKDVTSNINLKDEVFLRVTVEYDNTKSDTVKGKITDLYKYPDKEEYDMALGVERKDLN